MKSSNTNLVSIKMVNINKIRLIISFNNLLFLKSRVNNFITNGRVRLYIIL